MGNMIVGMFGLGEAGSLFAADLVAEGVRVQAFDPKPVATPNAVMRFDAPVDVVRGVDLILALTPQDDAVAAFTQAADAMKAGTLYADLSTSAPAVKRDIADRAANLGVEFADVALMAVVPGNGLRAPALVSGAGAERYVAQMTPFGVPVESVGPVAGEAATRKLLRSVMMKGLAALVIEAMRAAGEVGLEQWLWGNLVDEITAADELLLARLVTGTGVHARRRLHEMEACQSLLGSLGIDPVMTRSTVESLRRVPVDGVPVVPPT
jgi:3-hydroxyisobutyrate dehydrogenase-like beta-hydroxyacid dehydrogenase